MALGVLGVDRGVQHSLEVVLVATDITPNGTTGTLVEQCFMDPMVNCSLADLNVLAHNSARLCQRYTTMMTAYHYVRTNAAGLPAPTYYHSPYVTSYVFMAAGSYNIAVSTNKNTTGLVSGSMYVGTMSIDGTVLCTFGISGTTAIVPWKLTGNARWILLRAQVVSQKVDQFIANDYWVGYRKVV